MAFNNDNGTRVQLCDTAPLILNSLSIKVGSRKADAHEGSSFSLVIPVCWSNLGLDSYGPNSPPESKAFPCTDFTLGN